MVLMAVKIVYISEIVKICTLKVANMRYFDIFAANIKYI